MEYSYDKIKIWVAKKPFLILVMVSPLSDGR